MTAAEFAQKHAGDSVEYVNGQVRPLNTGEARHGLVCCTTATRIAQFIEPRHLGNLFAGGTFTRVPTPTDPERVYGPDVAFVASHELPDDDILSTPPIVVEVMASSDTPAALLDKVEDYLGAGVGVVVVIDPATRAVAVHRAGAEQQTFGPDATLTLPDVLPGFAVPVADLFR